jgi:D-lactate dehydrogenase
MNIKGFDPVKRSKTIKYISLEKGLAWADIIFCAADLNESSRGMLNYDTLSYAKKGAILANVSRGEITPLKDLKRLLAQKILGGIGLDVFPSEGKIADYLRGSGKSDENTKIILELKNNDNVIFTPHNAFNTKEALERKSKQTIEALNYYLKHKRFPNRLENKRG